MCHKAVMRLEATLRRLVAISLTWQDRTMWEISTQLGARSILKAVTDTMRMPIVDQYLEVDEDLEDSQLETKFSIGIHAEKGIELWRRGS